jgi:tripartite-type tricarboxylate transporter receptor subunit TctC
MSVTPFTTGVKDGQAGRRALLAAAAAGLAPIGAARGAGTYPERPVRVVVPFPAGGSVDIVARLVAQDLARTLGQPFVVDNRSGASGSIGTEFVAKSAPDGHTLLMGSAVSLAGNVSLYRNLPYDPVRDFAPISLVALQPNMVIVHPSLPVRTIAELIAYAKARPGAINYASSGHGSTQHLSGEVFCQRTRVSMVHVPYRGGAPALNDLIAGQVQLMFETIPTALQAARAGQVRPIAVTTARRSEAMPDLPTVAESGLPGYETRGWIGLAAPAGTPKEIVDLLAARTPEIARSPQVRSRLVDLGLEVVAGTPEQFGRFIRSEIESIRAVVTAAGVTPQ